MTVVLPPTSRLPTIASIASQPAEVLVDAIRYLRMVYSAEVRGAHRRIRARAASARSSGGWDNTLAPKDVPPESVIPPEMDLEELRSDAFERSYAIRWLTVLLHHAEGNITNLEQSQSSLSQAAQEVDSEVDSEIDAILEDAASLLAICSGSAAAGTFTRTFSFRLPQSMADGSETDTDIIKVQLQDIPLDNHDFSSVGAQTWGGACVLAELIVERPREFGVDDFGGIGIDVDSNTNFGSGSGPGEGQENPGGGTSRKKPNLRILELGAGTGLVSITLGKLYQKLARRGRGMGFDVDIVATDFYASVLRNLQGNIDLNFNSDLPTNNVDLNSDSDSNLLPTTSSSASSSGHVSSSSSPPPVSVSLTAHPLDWSLFPSSSLQPDPKPEPPSSEPEPEPKPPLDEPFDSPEPPFDSPFDAPFDEPFDIVLGSDIVYEPMHAVWIRACLGELLRRPGPRLQRTQSSQSSRRTQRPESLHAQSSERRQSPGQASSGCHLQSPGQAWTGSHPQSQASQPTFSPGQASTGSHPQSQATDLQPTPTFHLVIPLRPTHLQEARTVEEVFPKRADVLRRREVEHEHEWEHEREHEWEHDHKHDEIELEHEWEHEHQHAHEMELAIYSMETIACDTGSGFSRSRSRGEEEVEYVYYKIGWC